MRAVFRVLVAWGVMCTVGVVGMGIYDVSRAARENGPTREQRNAYSAQTRRSNRAAKLRAEMATLENGAYMTRWRKTADSVPSRKEEINRKVLGNKERKVFPREQVAEAEKMGWQETDMRKSLRFWGTQPRRRGGKDLKWADALREHKRLYSILIVGGVVLLVTAGMVRPAGRSEDPGGVG